MLYAPPLHLCVDNVSDQKSLTAGLFPHASDIRLSVMNWCTSKLAHRRTGGGQRGGRSSALLSCADETRISVLTSGLGSVTCRAGLLSCTHGGIVWLTSFGFEGEGWLAQRQSREPGGRRGVCAEQGLGWSMGSWWGENGPWVTGYHSQAQCEPAAGTCVTLYQHSRTDCH